MSADLYSFDSIDEDGRRRFERAWLEGHPGSIDQFLPPENDPRYQATLEELIHIQLEMAWKSHFSHAGSLPTDSTDTVEQPAPVEQYLERFPRLDQRDIVLRLLRQECLVRLKYAVPATFNECQVRFPDLNLEPAELESVLANVAAGGPDTDVAGYALKDAALPLPSHFGGYQLLDELGRGGMGVVYRARQIDADRIVAIKVIRDDAFDASGSEPSTGALVRFRYEAQAAAQLVHENIVTVYEAGEVDGRYFFSMRYIHGKSLAEMVARRPLDNRAAATYLEPVARAVAYAHEHGILHRDLKPQNILIDKVTDCPLVADFGLAKLAEHTRTLTKSGEVFGTPSYMSPEQARDASLVTESSDIYSLGATLYDLLTGRPPFLAATARETLHQLLEVDPAWPRQLNPAVDRELEAVCLMCLQKDPRWRYKSAQDVAEDLDRYLRGSAVRARPAARLAKAWSWCRRNPLPSAAIATMLICLTLALAGAAVGYRSIEAARDRSQLDSLAARSAVDGIVRNAHRTGFGHRPKQLETQHRLLDAALDYYQHFITQHQTDPDRESEVALARFYVGQIKHVTGDPSAALKAYQEADKAQQRLAEQRPDDLQLAFELSNTQTGIGQVHGQLNDWERALAAFTNAENTRHSLADRAPNKDKFRRAWANSLTDLGRIEDRRNRPDPAQRHLLAAQNIRKSLLEQQPTDSQTRRDLGIGYYELAKVQQGEWNHVDALKHFDLCVTQLEELADDIPAQLDADLAWYLTVSCTAIGDHHIQARQPAEATESYRKAETYGKLLVDDTRIEAQQEALMAQLYSRWGITYSQQEEPEKALDIWRKAIAKWETLLANDQVDPEHQKEYAVTLGKMAKVQLSTAGTDQAKTTLLRAKQILGGLVRTHPDETEYQDALHEILIELQRMNDLPETDP